MKNSRLSAHISKEILVTALVVAAEMIVYNFYVNVNFQILGPLNTIIEYVVKYGIAAILAILTSFFILTISVLKNKKLFDKILEIQTKKREAKRAIQSLFNIRVEEFLSMLRRNFVSKRGQPIVEWIRIHLVNIGSYNKVTLLLIRNYRLYKIKLRLKKNIGRMC